MASHIRRSRFLFLLLLALLAQSCAGPHLTPDAEFQRVADEYLAGYLAWRPASGMSLGLHEYDGRITDLSRASLDAELRRLKQFDARLARLDAKALTREAAFDSACCNPTSARKFSASSAKKITRAIP